MKTKVKMIPLLAAAILLVGCNKEEQPDASGSFEAVETIISAEAQGKIMQFNIHEGDELKTGQLVGVVDSVQLYLSKLQLLQTQKAILSGRPEIVTQLESLKKELENAKSDRNRIENLVKENVASQKQLDDATARVNVLSARLEALESSLSTTTNNLTEQAGTVNIQLKQVENQLSKCHIRNPVEGTVLTKYAEQDEMASIGKPLYKIADLRTIVLRAYVSGDQLPAITTGKKVKVLVDSTANSYREHEGTIEWISDKAEFTPKTIQTKDERANLVYAIKIRLKNDGSMKIGMYGEVKF